MKTITVDDVVQWFNDSKYPDDLNEYELYCFRDGDLVLYVGKTERYIADRLLEHLGITGSSSMTQLIQDNVPESMGWQIELYSFGECAKLVEKFYGKIKGYGSEERWVRWVELSEKALIKEYRPAVNGTNNEGGTALPEKYLLKQQARARDAFSRFGS